MSHRLHVGETSEQIYDCVLATPDGARDKLLDEWLMYHDGMFAGPWKIRIGNATLWQEVEPVIAEVLASVGNTYPDDVWAFYCGEDSIEHPTAEELRVWIHKANAPHQARSGSEAVRSDDLLACLDVLQRLTDRCGMVLRGVAEQTELFGLVDEAKAMLKANNAEKGS